MHEPVERWLQATQHHFALQRELPAQQAQVVDGNPPVAPEMRARMHLLGISRLYVHQAAALDHVAAGEHLLVTTGTASGKSLCYNLPVCAKLLGKDQATALYIFPTKALAQDQARRAAQWLPGPAAGKGIVIYDGDTAKNKRAALRRKARVLITNPDMLHVAILARHTVFKDFFRKLAFVVVDEIHSYGGVFGSHVANLFERLRRVSRFYGSKPRFIMASATIANGAKLAGWLAGERVQVVNRDGAAKPRRVLLAINPPLLDKRLGIREDYLRTTLDVVGELLQQGIRTLVFVQSRRQVEQLIRTFKDGLATPHVVSGYHAGYLPGERRDIESRWRQGGLQVLVATSALELGMDIGDVQAVVLAGYPGTSSAFWQRLGRMGRRRRMSVAVFIASAGPLDQYMVNHPEYFFNQQGEQVFIHPGNAHIMRQHIRCALYELPFSDQEPFLAADKRFVRQTLESLVQKGEAVRHGKRWFWLGGARPARQVSLRHAGRERLRLLAGKRVIAIIDRSRAMWEAHPGAVYLHNGISYLVLRCTGNRAILKPKDTDYYTLPLSKTTIQAVNVYERQPQAKGERVYGELTLTVQVTGYREILWDTNQEIGRHDLDMPETVLQTEACWYVLPRHVIADLREHGLWSNDTPRYGGDWRTIRTQVLTRDKNTCRFCGAVQERSFLHVHHLRPIKQFVQVEQANRLDNLVTLCPRCHQRAEALVRTRTGLSGLAFLLRRLVPALLHCRTGDVSLFSEYPSKLAQKGAALVIWERVAKGIGLARGLFGFGKKPFVQAAEVLSRCACRQGCPACVGPPGMEGLGAKRTATALFHCLTGAMDD